MASRLSRALDRQHPPWEVHLIQGYAGGTVIYTRLHHALADGTALFRVVLALADEEPADGVGRRPAGPPARRAVGDTRPPWDRPAAEDPDGRGAPAPRAPARFAALTAAAPQQARRVDSVDRRGRPGRAAPRDRGDRHRHRHVRAGRCAAPVAARPRHRPHGGQPADDGPGGPARLCGAAGRGPRQPVRAGAARPAGRDRQRARTVGRDRGADAGHQGLTRGVADVRHAGGNGPDAPASARPRHRLLRPEGHGVTTSVRGPDQPLHLAGQPITRMWAWAPMSADQSLSTSIVGYAGRVHVGFKVDSATVPDPHALVAGLRAELAELIALAPA